LGVRQVLPANQGVSRFELPRGARFGGRPFASCPKVFKLPPFFAGRVIDDSLRSPIRNGMTKKQTKRPRAGGLPHRRKSVLSSRMRDNSVQAQTEMLWTKWNVFRRALGITTGDIRSFQLYITDNGYRTVYLKDLRGPRRTGKA